MITKRAVDVVRAMLPTEGQAAIEWDSAAYQDIMREHEAAAGVAFLTLDAEVTEVLAELGRGRFSVLDTE